MYLSPRTYSSSGRNTPAPSRESLNPRSAVFIGGQSLFTRDAPIRPRRFYKVYAGADSHSPAGPGLTTPANELHYVNQRDTAMKKLLLCSFLAMGMLAGKTHPPGS